MLFISMSWKLYMDIIKYIYCVITVITPKGMFIYCIKNYFPYLLKKKNKKTGKTLRRI